MNKEDSLQELMTAWQQHSDRIEQIAGQHDLSHIKLAPRLLVLSSRRRRILSSLAMALVCLAAIVGMVILRQHYISDIFEQLFFAFLALLLFVTLIHSLRQIFLLRRQPFSFHLSPLTLHLSPYFLIFFHTSSLITTGYFARRRSIHAFSRKSW